MRSGFAVLLTAAVAATGLAAQELPADCYRTPRHSEGAPYLERTDAMADSLRPWLRDIRIDTPPSAATSQHVRGLWRHDSVAVESALAALVADRSSGMPVVVNASDWYERLSGNAMPMLAAVDDPAAAERRPNALGAIRRLQTRADEERVFAFACDAGWLLLRLQRDPEYARWAWGAHAISWPGQAVYVLKQAERLLPTPYRAPVRALRGIGAVANDSAFPQQSP